MPQIENIALREAFKGLGVEAAAQGDDILVRVGRGPEGLFVKEALGVTTTRRGNLNVRDW